MRNTMKILASVIAAVVLVPASDAVAQRRGLVDVSRPHERHGAWLSFGLGRGSESFRFSKGPSGYSESKEKPSFWLAAGGTVNPHLRLGGEINAWVNEFNDDLGQHFTQSLVGGLLTAQVFPVRNLGLFVKGGVGISRSGEDISGGTGTGETGFAYLYGAGYELKLARNFFLTPMIAMMKHTSTNGGPNPGVLGTLHEKVWTIGVGLTFQPGR